MHIHVKRYKKYNQDILNILNFQLGVVFLEQGKASQALAYLDKALEFDPEHEQALLNSAILLQELGRAELRKIARERLLKLLRKVFAFSQMFIKRIYDCKYCIKTPFYYYLIIGF